MEDAFKKLITDIYDTVSRKKMIGEKEDAPQLESVDLVHTNKIAPSNQKHSKLSAGNAFLKRD